MEETQFEKIARISERKEIACACVTCAGFCKRSPCLGTPQDIEKIVDAGYGDRVSVTTWMTGMLMGVTAMPVMMIQPNFGPNGCTFFKDGLCELHDKGLKPTEGKLSHHTIQEENRSRQKNLTWNVAKEWLSDENVPALERIIQKLKLGK